MVQDHRDMIVSSQERFRSRVENYARRILDGTSKQFYSAYEYARRHEKAVG